MSPEAARPLDIPARVGLAVDAVLDRKGLDLRVLNLERVTDFTDFFLICSAGSQRQIEAIGDAVQESLRVGEGVRPLHIEGKRGGHWLLLDYGDFVVHVFDPETRAFYDLERLWSDAPDVTGEFR
jgi:ribosome-associated protein